MFKVYLSSIICILTFHPLKNEVEYIFGISCIASGVFFLSHGSDFNPISFFFAHCTEYSSSLV